MSEVLLTEETLKELRRYSSFAGAVSQLISTMLDSRYLGLVGWTPGIGCQISIFDNKREWLKTFSVGSELNRIAENPGAGTYSYEEFIQRCPNAASKLPAELQPYLKEGR